MRRFASLITDLPGMACCEWWLAIIFKATEVPRLVNNMHQYNAAHLPLHSELDAQG